MRNIIKLSISLLIGIVLLSSCNKPEKGVDKSELKSLKDSASFAYGFLSGKQAKQKGDNTLNADIFARSFKQGYDNDSNNIFTEQECIDILDRYARLQQEGQYNNAMEKAQPNIQAAEKFLKENKNKAGVKTTVSGLQYKVIKQGKGVKPKANNGDRIRFRYALNILNADGSITKVQSDFDTPDSTPHLQGVDNFITGFTEAIQMMNAGSRYIVWIHPNLGYGMQDSPEIPSGSLLIFEIEVTDVLQNND